MHALNTALKLYGLKGRVLENRKYTDRELYRTPGGGLDYILILSTGYVPHSRDFTHGYKMSPSARAEKKIIRCVGRNSIRTKHDCA